MIINFDLLRAIAILLVTNSHFDAFYPDPRFATGGALGNALFFALSGYGLAHSYRNHEIGFVNWYWRRICRIFPSVWAVGIITLTWLGLWSSTTASSLVGEFLWPTRHWFVSAIMLFYVAFFAILVTDRSRVFELAAGVMLVPYFIGYIWFVDLSSWSIEGGYFKWIFYGHVMLLGAAVARHKHLLEGVRIRTETILLIAFSIAYFGTKLMMSVTNNWNAQFTIHLLTLPILLLGARVTAFAPIQIWSRNSNGGRIAAFISLIALEIYLLQQLFQNILWLRLLSFPMGAILASFGIVVSAYLVFRLAEFIRTLLPVRIAGTGSAPLEAGS